MSIEETLQGKWCLLIEEEPYSTEGRTLLEFRNGSIVDNDGVKNPYRVDGNTLPVGLGDCVTLTVNTEDPETDLPAFPVPVSATRLPAIVTTSYDDGSANRVEFGTLLRQVD